MRNIVVFCVTLIALTACGPRHSTQSGSLDLDHLAVVLGKAWPITYPVRITMTVQNSEGRELLHCRLTNTSQEALQIDQSGLPWNTPESFGVSTISGTGHMLPKAAFFMGQLVASVKPQPISIAPGQALEGTFELRLLPLGPVPRTKDLLLIWSYLVELDGQRYGAETTGVTLLPKRRVGIFGSR